MNHEEIIELEKMINNTHDNITGIVVQKNNNKVYEKYFHGYTAYDTGHVYSVTKSVFSALVGIAVDKGYIKSIDQRILEFFPEYIVSENEKTIQHITVRDMLTMTAPYKYEEEPFEAFFMSGDWMRFAIDLLGGKGQIGNFMYSAIVGTHILSGILIQSTGRPILDFATEYLFSPLEINVPRNVTLSTKEEHIAAMNDKNTSGWAVDPQGINPAGWGLFLTPGDMAKIGQLYLNGGIWNGRQIISSEWIYESTKEQSCWKEMSLPYGYLWWVIDDKEHAFAAMGDGGNVIYVNDKKKMVISISALFIPGDTAADRIELIKEYLEPIFEECSSEYLSYSSGYPIERC